MLAEKSLELIKELYRSKGKSLPNYNADLINQTIEEMKILFEKNQTDVRAAVGGQQEFYPSIQMRHAALERNKRCVLSYLFNRIKMIKELRWELGSVLPPETKSSMSEEEISWFTSYNRTLASYMRSLGTSGFDLTQDVLPPKNLFIEVRCLVDYGEFETQDGSTINLKKDTQHFLLRSECEQLVRQGILEHVVH